jgi:hypothetical protein
MEHVTATNFVAVLPDTPLRPFEEVSDYGAVLM